MIDSVRFCQLLFLLGFTHVEQYQRTHQNISYFITKLESVFIFLTVLEARIQLEYEYLFQINNFIGAIKRIMYYQNSLIIVSVNVVDVRIFYKTNFSMEAIFYEPCHSNY